MRLLNERKLEGLKEKWWNQNPNKADVSAKLTTLYVTKDKAVFIQLFFLKNCAEDEEDTGAISLDNLGGVFIVLIAGIFLAVITLGFENCYYKKKDPFLVESVVVKTSGFVEHVKKDF